jgi:predicted CXXCH cytochrome family protein
VRLAIALATAALGLLHAQAPPPFSHRLHLKLKLECTGCHAQAAASASAADNLLPKKEVCSGCHKDVTIPAPPVSPVAHFSHAQHLRLGNIAPILARAIDSKTYLSPPGDARSHLNGKNACTACHRGLEESDAVTAAAMPRMADCLVCHTQIDPPDTCELCHAKGMNLKPADHTPDFLDRHNRKSTVLDKASCAVCHGRKFTCLGCH